MTDPAEVVGRYEFGSGLSMTVGIENGRPALTNSGGRDVFGVPPGETVPAGPNDGPLFATDSLFLPAFGFVRHESRYRLVLDPGPWQQVGTATP